MPPEDGVRAELYQRADPPPAVEDQQRKLRSRLEGCLETDRLTVHRHPKRLPVDGGDATLDRYRAVETWADGAGVSLSPFFERREAYDTDTGQLREMVTLPVLWLTVSADDGLCGVYPHVDGAVRTVSDAVAGIEAGERPGSDSGVAD